MAVDPNSAAANAATTTTMAPARPSTTPQPLTRPISQLPQPPPPPPPPPIQLQSSHLYSSQPFYPPQSHLPIRPQQNPHPNSQLPKPHDQNPVPQGVLYPVASSGRGFIPKGARPLSAADQMVTVANPGGAVYPSPHSMVFPPHGVRPMGSPHLDYHLNYPLPMARPPNMQYAHLGLAAGPGSGPIKGVPVSAHPKVAPRPTNGYKDSRERSREDAFTIVRDRKVRITEDSSLYALCRSWLKNGVNEETQLPQEDVTKVLPKPLPASVVAGYVANNKEDEDGDKQEEDEKIDEQLSTQDLLKGHIQRAKKVRARLREERLQRITRYRSRLRLLLPPSVDQIRNDAAAGN